VSRYVPGALAGLVLAGLTACGTNNPVGPGAQPGPNPSPGDQLLAFTLSCQPGLLVGERSPCVAVASYRSGRQPVVSFESTWSSSSPDVVAVDGLGVMTGRSAGQANVTASYDGRQASFVVGVTAEDALRISSGQAHQGDFTPGSTVTMWLQGYYSVASAATGRLSLKITDQQGTITTTAPLTVTRGGDAFLLSSTFTVPSSSEEVCRTAVLEVGSQTISEPSSKTFLLWCIPIRR
jgi:hypothetical protein